MGSDHLIRYIFINNICPVILAAKTFISQEASCHVLFFFSLVRNFHVVWKQTQHIAAAVNSKINTV